jgi:hypothetical protein
VPRLVASHCRETRDKARHHVDVPERAKQTALAGDREVALDDQVIGNDAFDPSPLVVRLAADEVHSLHELVLKYLPEAFGCARIDCVQRSMQTSADSEHVLKEPLKEHRVPCLIRDLRGEEDPLVLVGRRMKERRQRVRDRLLADEEERHRVLHDLADVRGQVLPILDVGCEVQIGDGPLLPLPPPVQRGGIDLGLEEVIHMRLDVVHADPDEVFQRRLFDPPDCIEHRLSAHWVRPSVDLR